MTLADLIAQFRIDADDQVGPPYLASDDLVTRWVNEAEEEAALRKSLLHVTFDDIPVVIGTATYDLDENAFSIDKAFFIPDGAEDSCAVELVIVDRIDLDRRERGWRFVSEQPRTIIQDDTTVTLGCLPVAAGTLRLEGCRAPHTAMSAESHQPEIGRAHHRHLVRWALYRNFNRPDAEIHDPGRAQRELDAFEAYFGLRPDADLLKNFQANVPQHNKSVW